MIAMRQITLIAVCLVICCNKSRLEQILDSKWVTARKKSLSSAEEGQALAHLSSTEKIRKTAPYEGKINSLLDSIHIYPTHQAFAALGDTVWAANPSQAFRAYEMAGNLLEDSKVTNVREKKGTYLYNAACAASIAGDVLKSAQFLETAFSHGYSHLAHVMSDKDLANLRQTDIWVQKFREPLLKAEAIRKGGPLPGNAISGPTLYWQLCANNRAIHEVALGAGSKSLGTWQVKGVNLIFHWQKKSCLHRVEEVSFAHYKEHCDSAKTDCRMLHDIDETEYLNITWLLMRPTSEGGFVINKDATFCEEIE